MKTILSAAIAIAALAPRESVAQGTRIEIGAIRPTLDPVIARDRGMGEDGAGLQIAMDVEFLRYIVVSGEIGGWFYSDERPFRQNVICVPDCEGGSRLSSIRVLSTALSVGVQPPRLQLGRLGLLPSVRVGSNRAEGARTISGCSDCTEQALALEAGPFLEYRLTTHWRFRSGYGALVATFGLRDYRNDDAHFDRAMIAQFGVHLGQ
jgi:hypothetical protein